MIKFDVMHLEYSEKSCTVILLIFYENKRVHSRRCQHRIPAFLKYLAQYCCVSIATNLSQWPVMRLHFVPLSC